MTELTLNKAVVQIDEGELVSFSVEGYEYIHQKGSPGWRSSDTEMFPIIGPTNEAGFKVVTEKGNAFQDQHGLLRELKYTLKSSSATEAVFEKIYHRNTPVLNSKYPAKSSIEYLSWPYDFQFVKKFQLDSKGLTISFHISGEENMPFMLGYHPAFNLHISKPEIKTFDKTITLDEVLAVGSRALSVPDCSEITLKDEKNITIKTEGFGNFMLWTEVPNMVCIEPVSFYPYDVEQIALHQGFQTLEKAVKVFVVKLQP